MNKRRAVKNKNNKAVVVGGAGFIGSTLVDALVAEGFEVSVVDNLSQGKKEQVHKKAVLHVFDVNDQRRLYKVMKGALYVFHLAALPRVQFSIEQPFDAHVANVDGTLSVLISAQQAGVKRVIYSASSSAYGDQPTLPLVETMRAAPKSPYGLQKYIGELYMRLWYEVYGLETVSLRYFNVYGPRLNPDGAYALVIGRFLKQRMEGKPMTITGDGRQTRDFTHVRDVVRANILAAKSTRVGKGEVFNIGAGKNISILDVAKAIGGPVTYIPARLEPHDTLADNSSAKKILGWKPEVTFAEGIKELKKIYKVA